MVGSGLIIYMISRGRKRSTYHRLMLGMSFADFLLSFWGFIGMWAVPEGTSLSNGAKGTQGTCTAQGFFLQLGIAAPLYNLLLCLYYLAVISYNWTEKRVVKLEMILHCFVWVTSLGMAIAGILLDLYNSTGFICFVSGFPITCETNSSIECIRGKNARIYRVAFLVLPIWSLSIVSIAAMLKVYWTVYKQEKAVAKYQGSHARKLSREVAWQAFWYFVAFFVVWIPIATESLVRSIRGLSSSYQVTLLVNIFLPLQGAFNFLLYIRPRYLRYRRNHKNSSLVKVAREVVCQAVCFCKKTEDVGESPVVDISPSLSSNCGSDTNKEQMVTSEVATSDEEKLGANEHQKSDAEWERDPSLRILRMRPDPEEVPD